MKEWVGKVGSFSFPSSCVFPTWVTHDDSHLPVETYFVHHSIKSVCSVCSGPGMNLKAFLSSQQKMLISTSRE